MEKWLIECEAIMRQTVKDVVKKSFDDYARSERIDWVLNWPGQAIICVDCMYWTVEGANAVKTNSLPEYAEKLTEELMKIVNKVKLKTIQFSTLGLAKLYICATAQIIKQLLIGRQ